MPLAITFFHGNGCSRHRLYNHIREVREWAPGKPVLCNEDSQAIGQLEVAFKTRTSWGYYNNLAKQEPQLIGPLLGGEVMFFAHWMAVGCGLEPAPIPESE